MSKDQIGVVLEDLKTLFKKDEILGKDFDNFLKQVKTSVVKDYLTALKDHTKPEDALKYYFFSKDSVFVKFLFKKLHPEVGGESGFVDYLIKDEREEIKLEIKPLFEAEFERGKSGEIFKRIKKVKLNWEKHKDQIRKYLGRRGEFVVFTNLEEWYFFSRNFSLDENCYYFAKVNLFDLIKDFQQIGDFWEYLDRQEELSVKEPLDKKFFNSLRTWVEELGKVKFKVDEKKKTELIIKLINKFIFIQTLDNFWVIKGKYLDEKWINIEREWQAKNKLRILRKFLSEINEYFYELYDTELFRDGENGKTILDYIERTDENIELFYNKLKLVLGIDYGTTAIGWERGIIQYNFRRIDEDILGKAYETFLAEVRKEQGIYYTPKYITQYIVENTVGKIYDELLEKIKRNLEEKNFDECKKLIKKFISIKVLDPACGSGSFLIKALRLIWNKYNELLELLAKEERKYNNFKNGLTRSKEDEENSRKISELRNILNFKDKRDLISKIIIRHIHGNDLDANALEVAKVNLWLEAIKLAPSEFRYDRLPADTNHILPDLEMNLGNGDSLVGLPEDLTIEILKEKYEDEIKKLFELRKEYLDDPTKEEAIKEINKIKKKLRKELDEEFKKYLEENNLPLEILEKTKPFHWALDFWFVFFAENLEPKEKDKQGFDAVVGNPPWGAILPFTEQFIKKYFRLSAENINSFELFLYKSIFILTKKGYQSFIIPKNFIKTNDYIELRKYLVNNTSIIEISDAGKCFEGVTQEAIIEIISKELPSIDHIVNLNPYFKNNPLEYLTAHKIDKKIKQAILREIPDYIINIVIDENLIKIREKIGKSGKPLSYFVTHSRGIEYGKKGELIRCPKCGNYTSPPKKKRKTKSCPHCGYILSKKDPDYYMISKNRDSKHTIPIYVGMQLERYFIEDPWWLDINVKGVNYKKPEIFHKTKILLMKISDSIKAHIDEEGYYTTQALYMLSKKEEGALYSLKEIVGILNSKLMNFYYEYTFNIGASLTTNVTLENILRLPIKIPKTKNIDRLVQKIITLKKLQHKFRE